jgi:hypothetical protein
MTFSLRDLLALFVLLALALLGWRTWQQTRLEKARLAELRDEIKQLEIQVRLDNPALHQAMLNTLDEHQPLAGMRQRSLGQFERLRTKYGGLEPRGADVLSLRGLPSLPEGDEPAPVLYRLWVPEDRPVWLKFGVHEMDPSHHRSRSSDDEQDLLDRSPFTLSGPFEMRLPPGDQTLRIAIGAARGGELPVSIALDDTVLLRSTFASEGVSGASYGYTTAASQVDFPANQKPPWLLTASMQLRNTSAGKTQACSVWLSDRASGFAPLPGAAR